MNLIEELCRCRAMAGAATTDNRFAYPGSTPHYAPDRTFDTQHILLELAIDFPRKTLKGKVTTTLRAIADGCSSMVFDAIGYRDVRVTSGARKLKFENTSRQIKVYWPKPVPRGTRVDVTIQYRVVDPKLGLHFIGPDRRYPKKPVQAWTQGEDEYNRYWFPCHDAPQERATTEMIVTVPAASPLFQMEPSYVRSAAVPRESFTGSITSRILPTWFLWWWASSRKSKIAGETSPSFTSVLPGGRRMPSAPLGRPRR